jgi:hypothetical protein
MIKIIAFAGGYKGDMLAAWLNKEYYATNSSTYSANSTVSMGIKNCIAANCGIHLVNGGKDMSSSAIEMLAKSEEDEFLNSQTELFIPYHLSNRTFTHYQSKHLFSIYEIISHIDLANEIAFNITIKRANHDMHKEYFESRFTHYQHAIRGRISNQITLEKISNNYVSVDYQRVFKDMDSDYIYSIFNRQVDMEFIRMNQQTTLPDIVDTPAGKVSLRDGKLFWHT